MAGTTASELRRIVLAADWPALAAAASADKRVLSRLLPLTYQPEGLLRWRAVEGLGRAAAVVAARDPEFVRGILRRLHWSLSDESGGIGWSAPEAMGAIVAACEEQFGDYGRIVVSLAESLEEEYFHAGILWAIGQLAAVRPALAGEAEPWLRERLRDPRPQVRGLAVWCLGLLAPADLPALLAPLRQDTAPLDLYRRGELAATTVGGLAREALGETAPN